MALKPAAPERETNEFILQVKTRARWIATCLLDALFLGMWVIIQHWLNQLVEYWRLSFIDNLTLYIFQGVFAIVTLVPIIVYSYVDIAVILKQARGRLMQRQ
jgi:hypothetical protein